MPLETVGVDEVSMGAWFSRCQRIKCIKSAKGLRKGSNRSICLHDSMMLRMTSSLTISLTREESFSTTNMPSIGIKVLN